MNNTFTKSTIPTSAATRNLNLALCAGSLTAVLYLCSVFWWITLIFGIIACKFVYNVIRCILDIQEFSMKEQHEVLKKLCLNSKKG